MFQQPNKLEIVNRAKQQTGGQSTPMKNGRYYGRLENNLPVGNGMF
jgi:hypothetical protein